MEFTKIMVGFSQQEQNLLSGLDAAVGNVPSFLLEIFSRYVSPIIAVVCLGLLLILFGKAGFEATKMKETFETNTFGIILLGVIIAICLSFFIWGPKMLGK